MSDTPPTDELRALIALEKGALVDPGPARARLADRLALPLQTSPPRPPQDPSAVAPSGWWKRGVLTGLGGFGAGVAVTTIVRSLWAPAPAVEVRYVDRVVEIDRFPDAAALPVPPSAPPAASLPPPQATPRSTRPSSTASVPAPGADEALARERQVIEKARSALARHDAAAALAAVDEHTKSFPHGQLVEMREALAVQALVDAGRGAEAKARAERFHRTFPSSMYSSVVDGAISSIP
jgi:hypothetical protein